MGLLKVKILLFPNSFAQKSFFGFSQITKGLYIYFFSICLPSLPLFAFSLCYIREPNYEEEEKMSSLFSFTLQQFF